MGSDNSPSNCCYPHDKGKDRNAALRVIGKI